MSHGNMCGVQRSASANWLSPSIMWSLGIYYRLSDLAEAALPANYLTSPSGNLIEKKYG